MTLRINIIRQKNRPENCFQMKKTLLRWDSNPQTYTTYETDALPTELSRQLSWLGRIKAMQEQRVMVTFDHHTLHNVVNGRLSESTVENRRGGAELAFVALVIDLEGRSVRVLLKI